MCVCAHVRAYVRERVCMHMHIFRQMQAIYSTHMKSEDNLMEELVLCFCHVCPEDLTQIVSFSGSFLYPLVHPAGPSPLFFCEWVSLCSLGLALSSLCGPEWS